MPTVTIVVVVPEPVCWFFIVARRDSQVMRCAEAFGSVLREKNT